MITFITSLRHPLNSSSWEQVSQLFEGSIRSISNQSDSEYQIIVVCNALPSVSFQPPNIEYVLVDFPPPSSTHGPRTGLEAVRIDKGSKYLRGLLAAEKYAPEYVMFFDADDFVHQDLASFCNAHPNQNGWFVEHGYSYRLGGILCHRFDQFHKLCGTCNIFRFDLLRKQIPEGLHAGSTLEEIVNSTDGYFLKMILGAHPFAAEYFADKGVPMEPLPFPGAVYVIGTSENHSGRHILTGVPYPVTPRMNRRFGMGLPLSIRTYLRGAIDFPIECFRIFRYR